MEAPEITLSRRRCRQAGPLVMIDLPGLTLDAESRAFIEAHDVRAVILFKKNLRDGAQVRRLVEDLRVLMGPEALIGIDQEGGGVVRTGHLPYPPSAMSLGAARDADLARRVGAAAGRGLASVGINWDFAPVLDVNNNPGNPVIVDRSFGEDPSLVRVLGLAWAEGLMSEGVAACVKHFPGHGDTVVDTHLGLPVVNKDEDELKRLELAPFHAAVAAGVPCVMTCHIVFPAFDAEHPATLSEPILTGLLRRGWGFDGVIVTDSMGMDAVEARYERGEAATLALRAGADLVLAIGDWDAKERTVQGIEKAFDEGLLTAEASKAARRRLAHLAQRFPGRTRDYSPEQRREDAALMAEAWARGLTSYRDPLPPTPGSRVILVTAEGTPGGEVSDRGLSGHQLARTLARVYDLQSIFYNPADPIASREAFEALDREGAAVILATSTRHRPGEALKALIDAVRPDLHLALWNPYAVRDVPAPALITYGFRPEALTALAQWLRGEIEANGQPPVSLDG